jgi:hypothetical protein
MSFHCTLLAGRCHANVARAHIRQEHTYKCIIGKGFNDHIVMNDAVCVRAFIHFTSMRTAYAWSVGEWEECPLFE